MKKLLLLLLFIPLVSFGQKSNDADALKLCVALQSNNFTTDAEAEDAVNKILSVIGASQKPILQACSNINNAVAAVYKGQRYILYDRDFMNSLTAGSNKYWSNMFILAHEMGHHINGHSLDIILYASDIIDPKSLEEKRKQELEADEFAGFVLAKLGATLSQTSKVLSNLPRISNENFSTHPSKDKRIASVRIGFGKGQIPRNQSENKTIISKQIIKNKPKSGFVKFGDWFRKEEMDVFSDIPFVSLVEGITVPNINELQSNLEFYTMFDNNRNQYRFGISGLSQLDAFFNFKERLKGSNDDYIFDKKHTFIHVIVLDSKSKQIFNGKMGMKENYIISEVKEIQHLQFYLDNNDGFQIWNNFHDSLLDAIKNGEKLILKFIADGGDYISHPSWDSYNIKSKEANLLFNSFYVEFSLRGSSKAIAKP